MKQDRISYHRMIAVLTTPGTRHTLRTYTFRPGELRGNAGYTQLAGEGRRGCVSPHCGGVDHFAWPALLGKVLAAISSLQAVFPGHYGCYNTLEEKTYDVGASTQ
jgi:hypothetical protein